MRPYREALSATLRSPSGHLGFFTAFFVAVGRWSVGRLDDSLRPGELLADGRIHLLLVLLLTMIIFVVMSGDPAVARNRPLVRTAAAASLATAVWMAMTGLWHGPGDYAAAKAWDLLLLATCLIALTVTVLGRRAVRERVIVGFWMGLHAITFALGSMALLDAAGETRLSVLGGGPNTLGRLMGALAISSLALRHAGMLSPRQASAGVGVGLVSLILTGSRGAAVAMIAAALWLLLFRYIVNRSTVTYRLRTFMAVLSVGIAAIAAGLVAPVLEAVNERYVALTLVARHLAGRDQIAARGLACVREAPPQGFGAGWFDTYHGLSSVARYPHNLLLEVGCEGGVIGLVLLVLMAVASLTLAVRISRTGEGSFEASLFVFFLVASQASGDLYDSRAVFAVLIIAAARSRVIDDQQRSAAVRDGPLGLTHVVVR